MEMNLQACFKIEVVGFMDLFYHHFICLERKVQVFTEVQEITFIFRKIAQTMQEYGDYRKNKE